MVGQENPIIPILDRRAPILERIRNGSGEDNVAQNLGELVGRIIKTDSKVEVEQTKGNFKQGFTESLSNELGVQGADIDPEFVGSMSERVTNVSEDDVLRAGVIEELDIQTEDLEQEENMNDGQREQQEGESNSVSGLFDESEGGETAETEGTEEAES